MFISTQSEAVQSIKQPFITTQYVPYRNIPEYVKYSCVLFAKWYTGHEDEVWGNARDIKATSSEPYVGGYILTNESALGHIVVITRIEGDNLYVIESNYYPGKISERVINRYSPDIRGFK
jgi:hypothetical protein